MGAESTSIARRLWDLLVLTKARVNVLVVGTTFVGFALHARILPNWSLLLQTLAGTGLVAGSAAVANQALEQSFDRNMARTRNRPLAAGRLRWNSVVLLSGTLLGAGCLWLGAGVNLRAMSLAGLTFLIYTFAYTPLKRYTPACMLVGAVAGALPVLIGWAATDADFGLWTFVAFAVLFLWQIPHFLAIAWWRRADYSVAGFHVLPRGDDRGYRTAGSAVAFAVAMVVTSLVPVLLHRATARYLPVGLALGIAIITSSIRFLVRRNEANARSLFVASLFYLPVLYLLMLFCSKQA
jgi:protoheme IX farnesyltransferase